MLKIIKSMSELDIEQLMAVYAQTNETYSTRSYPDASLLERRRRTENTMLSYLREDFFRRKGSFYAVWQCGGVYRSALRLEVYADGYLITSLETAPEARRMGYAYALLQAVLSYLCESGCPAVYAHIEKRNVASLRLHEKCGFAIISDSASYIDGTVTQKSCTVCCQL